MCFSVNSDKKYLDVLCVFIVKSDEKYLDVLYVSVSRVVRNTGMCCVFQCQE